jgi:hypothetical protein
MQIMPKTGAQKPETVSLPQREIPVAAQVDVLVVGGGPTGVSAAVGAARMGTRVLILEQAGFLGGVSTNGLYLRLSTLQGDGVPYRIIGGVAYEFTERVIAAQGGNLRLGHLSLDYEIAKRVWERCALEAGVDLLLNTTVFDIIKEDDALSGVVALNKSGLQAFLADVIIDCSGDGDVAARAGAPFEIGRPSNGFMQPVTMMMRFGGVDMTAFHIFLKRDPHLTRTLAEGAARGDFALELSGACINHWSGRPDVLNLNVTNQTHVNGTDGAQLSSAEIEGRRQVWLLYDFLKKHVPGFENAWLIDTAPHVGVRETRRIVGEYVLTEQDVMEGREYPDTVALGSYPVDIHNPEGGETRFVHIRAPCYGIPYRCLVPLEVENLLVAGRSISATHEALGSTRVMFTCMATGHAAGIAAALASQRGVPPRYLDIKEVQAELVAQDALISGDQARKLNARATLARDAEVAEYILQNY